MTKEEAHQIFHDTTKIQISPDIALAIEKILELMPKKRKYKFTREKEALALSGYTALLPQKYIKRFEHQLGDLVATKETPTEKETKHCKICGRIYPNHSYTCQFAGGESNSTPPTPPVSEDKEKIKYGDPCPECGLSWAHGSVKCHYPYPKPVSEDKTVEGKIEPIVYQSELYGHEIVMDKINELVERVNYLQEEKTK